MAVHATAVFPDGNGFSDEIVAWEENHENNALVVETVDGDIITIGGNVAWVITEVCDA